MTSQLDSLFDWENYENESLYECVCVLMICARNVCLTQHNCLGNCGSNTEEESEEIEISGGLGADWCVIKYPKSICCLTTTY